MIGRSLRFVLWCATVLAVVGFLVLAAHALVEPVTSDPLEATILERATRVAEDRPLFTDAGAQPATALMPGMPLVVSVMVRLFDARLWEPRLVSLLSIALAALLVGLVVRLETKSATLGAAGITVLLMGQGLIAGAPAVARPESLAFLLALLGLITIRYLPGIPGALLAALPVSAACFTHPHALWFAAAGLVHFAVHDRRRFFAHALGLAALVGGTHVALWLTIGPWYNYEAWDVFLQALHFAPIPLISYVGTQLLGPLGVFTLGTVLAFTLPVRPWRGAVGLWTWFGFAALGCGIAATQSGAEMEDALRPAAFALAVLGPISIQRVTQHLSAWPGSNRRAGQHVMLTALVLQFLTLFASATSLLRFANN